MDDGKVSDVSDKTAEGIETPNAGHRMEMRKIRTLSARMQASKEDKVINMVPIAPKMNTLAAQLAKVGSVPIPIPAARLIPAGPLPIGVPPRVEEPSDKDETPVEEEIDVSNELQDESGSKDADNSDIMVPKPNKIQAVLLNGDFPVANEVTITSMKYSRPPQHIRKVTYRDDKSDVIPRGGFTGETLNLKSSDLSVPNKAAHFLYFRCYEETEVQKEFPLTIDENRKGPQNFLVEPRVGLKNTDYYIDSYLWNRGKSTSSKKKIFVEIDGNHVKTSRRSIETAHYLLNWYYSNMESRICKKVCWLETVTDGSRASPVLVQYHINYLSDNPIELRKTPKLYSDTRQVAQELLRSDSPLQTVQRFVETGETDPREIINKKQAYDMRRYVLASARKRSSRKNNFEDAANMFYDEEMYEEVYYDEQGEPTTIPNRHRESNEASRIAQMACRLVGRKLEDKIASLIDNRLGSNKRRALAAANIDVQNHVELLSEWINTLSATTADDVDIAIHNVTASMRKALDELLPHVGEEYIEVPGPSATSKRRHDIEEIEEDGESAAKRNRFEGESFIFEGQEYVEEEVIAEGMTEVPSTSANGEPTNEVKFERTDGPTFFFPAETANDVTVDQ